MNIDGWKYFCKTILVASINIYVYHNPSKSRKLGWLGKVHSDYAAVNVNSVSPLSGVDANSTSN
jgi:hypothetical protein